MIARALIVAAAGALSIAASAPSKIDMAARLLPPPAAPGPATMPYVRIAAKTVVLTHVRVIDGTGAPAQADRTIVIADGRIAAIGGPELAIPAGADVLDMTGHSAMPGIIGMHDHPYYIARPNLDAAGKSEPPLMVPEMAFSSPRLYLATGVTTTRTTGSVEPYTDLNLKKLIDAGSIPGPHMDVTGPYLEGAGSPFAQMHQLHDGIDARRTVEFWADQGATSFKAYMNITRAELKSAIDAAHARGIKVTGHLCSITYPEAVALGIDNLEHGFFVNTQLDPGKAPDLCPKTTGGPTLAAMKAGGPEATALIKQLVDAHVALTSTLPVFEQNVPNHAPLDPRVMAVMTADARTAYLYARNRRAAAPPEAAAEAAAAFANAQALERQFVSAGGLLMAGLDPTGNGGVVPGFGDQREIELLVDAGFTPIEAIRIATLNGAVYLGVADRIGSIAVGKNADLVLMKGDPSRRIADIENVEIVFKDGIGYDPARLIGSVQGRYGQY